MIDLTKFPRLAAMLARRKPTTQTLFQPMQEIPAEWRDNAAAKQHYQEMAEDRKDLPF
jgi:hypothetical protein